MNTNWELYNEVERLPGGEPGVLGSTVDWEWRLLRDYEPTCEDGAPARVWACRAPAQFFRLTAGDVEVTTGSGTEMGELMIRLAQAISAGMVGIHLAKPARDRRCAEPQGVAGAIG